MYDKLRILVSILDKQPTVGPARQILTEAIQQLNVLEAEDKPILVVISGEGAWAVPDVGFNLGHLKHFAEAGDKKLMRGFVINLFGVQPLAPRHDFDPKYYSGIIVL